MQTRSSLYLIKLLLCLLSIFVDTVVASNSEFCEISTNTKETHNDCGKNKYTLNRRYILYDINPPEGFNLRRDVYIRVAVFMKHLNNVDHNYEWNLILPPWGHLYHWRSRDIGKQSQIPWSQFFDVTSLKRFIPVMEMFEFLEEYESQNGETSVDRVFVLQNDPKMFESGDFRDKNEVVPCNKEQMSFEEISKEKFTGHFWGYTNITAKDVQCLVFHGTTSHLVQNLEPDLYRTYMFDHMEIPLHDFYGSQDFWRARRSMRYKTELYKIASNFREKYLNSTDDQDKTERPEDWREERQGRKAIGGPYLAVHWRRRDFVAGRGDSVPSINSTAAQLVNKMRELNLKVAFVATDAADREFNELKKQMENHTLVRYVPTNYVKETYQDGGVAIIDQIICSHARYFIGTHESTFTFRIQEEREILGFPVETTFNRLCVKSKKCGSGSQWKIVW